MEAGRRLLRDLIGTGIPAWLHPDTDYIVSFPPFHNLPTQYREGQFTLSSAGTTSVTRRGRERV